MSSPIPNQTISAIHGGQVLLPERRWAHASLALAGGCIAAEAAPGRSLDASGCLLLPGIVDFHGDAFERQIMPRPGVQFPLELALLETDRQLACNGITTALHGLTYSWEGGLRGGDTAMAFFAALDALAPRLQVAHRVHLRFECHHVGGEDQAMAWLRSGRVSLLAFNEHLPMMRRKVHKLQDYAERAGTDGPGFMARLEAAATRSAEVPALLERLAAEARRLGIPMASHDDDGPATRARFQALGCRVSEFPLTREVAQQACAQGSPVVCGAPNVLRGGSHVGAPGAAELAGAGLCSILASDYYYPAPLHAAFKLAQDGVLPLESAWALLSAHPAAALGLHDRGLLAAGRRADLLLVDAQDLARPRLVATLSAGRIVYLAEAQRLA
jgi:alpha-D-ribose 1-methylphosphonate 5-triphosphate diphosphatase